MAGNKEGREETRKEGGNGTPKFRLWCHRGRGTADTKRRAEHASIGRRRPLRSKACIPSQKKHNRWYGTVRFDYDTGVGAGGDTSKSAKPSANDLQTAPLRYYTWGWPSRVAKSSRTGLLPAGRRPLPSRLRHPPLPLPRPCYLGVRALDLWAPR